MVNAERVPPASEEIDDLATAMRRHLVRLSEIRATGRRHLATAREATDAARGRSASAADQTRRAQLHAAEVQNNLSARREARGASYRW